MAGQVGKPHGITGEVHVVPVSDDPKRFEAGAQLVHEDGRRLEVGASRRHRDRLLVRFSGVHSRDQAEALRGRLYVTPAQLRKLDTGEYWEHEVVGCSVLDAQGNLLGKVTRVVAGPAQDLLAVVTPRGEKLVPVVKSIVVEIDVGARRIVIDAPAGLLD